MTAFAAEDGARRPGIVVICRGSREEGLGHATRSAEVAQCLAAAADVEIVLIGDRHAAGVLERAYGRIRRAADDLAAEAIVRHLEPDAVVVDAIRFDRRALVRMRRSALVAGLSPVFDALPLLDVVYHRTRELGPLREQAGPATDLVAGLEHAVIRASCRPIPSPLYRRSLEPGPLPVAISMGGGDAENRTLAVVARLVRGDRPLLLWVLVGEGYGHRLDDLVARVRTRPRHEIILARTTDAMWRVAANCALAVLAGGTTTYEAARAGLPTVNLVHDAQQAWLVRELVDRGAAIAVLPPLERALDDVARAVEALDADRGRLLAMHEAARMLVDGAGAGRIAADLLHRVTRRRAIAPPRAIGAEAGGTVGAAGR